MSIIEPKIDVLLDRTDNDRFLLCALASTRSPVARFRTILSRST